jgi:hypothetical protein
VQKTNVENHIGWGIKKAGFFCPAFFKNGFATV